MSNSNEQFSQIYDQYIDKIYRFVYLKVNSQEIAQDLTSKVFLKGWEAYQNQGDSIKNPGAFLYQIARNIVVDHYREKAKANIVSADLISPIADPEINLQDKAILSSDMEMVKSAIQNLKKDYQDIIIWHYIDGITAVEIGKIMEKPTGTVRVMLHRGLNALKKELDKGVKEA